MAGLTIAAAAPAPAGATVYNVSNTNDVAASNPASGSCATPNAPPTNGACTLRSAVQASNNVNGDNTINLAAGTYKLTIAQSGGNDDSTGDLNVTNTTGKLTINGAGSGTNGSIVDANFIDRAFHGGPSSLLEIDRVRIRNGRPGTLGNINSCPSSPPGSFPGGGILIDGGLTLTNDVITANMATDRGGGIYADGGRNVSISNTDVTDNILCAAGSFNFIIGAGMAYEGFTDLAIDHSNFVGNHADSSDSGGGGLAARTEGTEDINHSTFRSNTASTGGGIYGDSAGKGPLRMHLFADLIAQNNASGGTARRIGAGAPSAPGAGVEFEGGEHTIVNTTVHANNGDGIEVGFGSATVSYSTVTQNNANLRQPGKGNITIDDTIVAQPGPSGNCNGSITAGDHNLFDDDGTSCNAASTDLTNKNPKLGPLQDNGGATQTRALQLGSPALDAGNSGNCTQIAQSQDQRDVSRPQGPGCDIGAFELQIADLALTAKPEKDQIKVGEQDKVTDTVTNNGPSDANNVVFKDPAPAGFTIKSVKPSQGSCTHTETTVNCHLGKLAVGKSATIVIVLRGNSKGTITLKSSVTGQQPDPNLGNNKATVRITVVQPPRGLCGKSKFHFIYDTEDGRQDDRVTLARVYIDGKQTESHRGHNIHTVTFHPTWLKGKHFVMVVGFLTDGRRIILSRTYHGCRHGDTIEHFEERSDPGSVGGARAVPR